MARRKLNTKFIVVLCVVGLLAVGAVVAMVFQKPIVNLAREYFGTSVAELEKQGDEAIAKGDYAKGMELYGKAIGRSQANIELQIKYVDAFDLTVNGNEDAMKQLREYYNVILRIDPGNVPAMRRLLKVQLAGMRGYPDSRPGVRAVIETADRILNRVPDDREAGKALVYAALEPYQRGLEVPPIELDRARGLARKLYDADPNDGEAVAMMARLLMQDAQAAAVNGKVDDAKANLQKAREFIDQAMVKAPENAEAYFYGYQIYYAVRRTTPAAEASKRVELAKIAEAHLEKADSLANSTLPPDRLIQIRWFAIRMMQDRDRAGAEQRYRKLITELPNNRWPRLMLAQFLATSPDRREDTIALLESPFNPTKPPTAMESFEHVNVQMKEQLRLAVVRLGSLDQMSDPEKRAARLKQVEDAYSRLKTQVSVKEPWIHRIAGGLAIEHKRMSEAIEELDTARKLIDPNSDFTLDRELLNEVLFEYAEAHLQLGHTGRARPALEELVSRDPTNIRARVRLTQVLISEQSIEKANKQIDDLKRFLPANPLVQSLEVQVLALQKDELRGKYPKYPETTRAERMVKAQAASSLEDMPEVIRLGRLMVGADANDADAAIVLARGLARHGQKEEAKVVVEQALKMKPDHGGLKSLQGRLGVESPTDLQELAQTQIEGVKDAYKREMLLAEMRRSEGKLDEALEHAVKASQEKPEDVTALDMQFTVLVTQKKFAEATEMLPKFVLLKGDDAGVELRKLRLKVAQAQEEKSPDAKREVLAQALQEAAQVAKKYEDIAAASLLYAQLLHSAERYGDAIEQYMRTLDKSPTNVDALRGAAQCMVAANRINEARDYIKRARQLAPRDTTLKDLELGIEIERGDPLIAIDVLVDRLQKDPDDRMSWLRLGAAFEQAAVNKSKAGDSVAARQFSDRAVKHWAAAIEKFPNDLQFAAQYADAQRRAGNASAAEQAIETVVKLPAFSDKPEAVELLAEQYLRSGKTDKAEAALKDLIGRVNPPPTRTVLRLAMLYVQMNRLDLALGALDLKKDDPDVRRERIELLIAADRLDLARAAVEEAIAAPGGATPAFYRLAALTELKAGNFSKADGFLSKVLSALPNDPAARFYRSQVRLSLNPPDVNGAYDDLQSVVAAVPTNIEARLSLSDLLVRRGDRSGAVGQLEKAWQANRGSKVVLMRLLDGYAQSSPPRTIDAMRLIGDARQTPQLASDPDVNFAEASVYITRSDSAKAIDIVKKTMAGAKDEVALKHRGAEILLRAKAYRDVVATCEGVIEKDKNAIWAYVTRAQAYRRLEQRAESGKDFNAAFNLAVASKAPGAVGEVVNAIAQELGVPEAIKRIEPIANDDNEYRILLGGLLQASGDPARAIDVLERVVADKQRLTPAQAVVTLRSLGGLYLQVSPPMADKALATYEELYKLTPDDLALINNIACVQMMPRSGGSVQKALEYSTRGYEMCKDYSTQDETVLYVWDTYGWALIQNKKVLEGLDVLRRAAQQAKFPDVFLHLAEGYMIREDWDRAESALTDAERYIKDLESQRRLLDPTIRPKLEELTDSLKAKKRDAAARAK